MSNSFEDIRRVLQTYFDGLYYSDTERLARVFHAQAVYATADETPALVRTMDEYFPLVAARVSPASRDEPRKDSIEAIERAGENTIHARVRCSIGRRCVRHSASECRKSERVSMYTGESPPPLAPPPAAAALTAARCNL